MYFGRRFQTMDTYKTNNTGDDVSEEIFGGLMGFSDGASSVLGVKRPSVPPFGKNRYLDNQTHMVSANSIVRLRGDLNLRANVQYQHDLREDEGTSVTTVLPPSWSEPEQPFPLHAQQRSPYVGRLLRHLVQ